MIIKFSKAIQLVKESPLQSFASRVSDLKKSGKKIINLGVGEPYNNTPEKIKTKGIEAIENDKTGYLPASGSKNLKIKLANKYGAEEKNIIVFNGAKIGLAATMQVLLDPKDIIFIPSPYYPPFYDEATLLGADIKLLATEDEGFKLTAETIEKAIRRFGKPKLLIINSPNNPTGIEYDKDELKKIAELSLDKKFLIISDECYGNFSQNKNFSLRQFSNNIIVINSFSKTYSMPGWRIAWGIMPEKIATELKKILGIRYGCPSSISEYAALEALNHSGIDDFTDQRNYIQSWLEKHSISYPKSKSGFYVFAKLSEKIKGDSIEIANKILDLGVAVTPGISFGDYDDYLRISYSVTLKDLKTALKKIEKLI